MLASAKTHLISVVELLCAEITNMTFSWFLRLKIIKRLLTSSHEQVEVEIIFLKITANQFLSRFKNFTKWRTKIKTNRFFREDSPTSLYNTRNPDYQKIPTENKPREATRVSVSKQVKGNTFYHVTSAAK